MAMTGLLEFTQLNEGSHAVVYRARRAEDGARVVIKALRGAYPGAEALAQFRREAEITRQVQGPGVIELLGVHLEDSRPHLVLEDFDPRSLAGLEAPLPAATVIRIALQLVEALGRVHDALVIHKDISPANVVWNPATGVVKLIDFGIASTVGRQREGLQSPALLRGTLAYIAPEQTGRMNRSVDYRSDYYALGGTLYELLTGAPPFPLDDPLQLVHAHVARTPIPAHERVAGVPEDISAVVAKLLAKTAEARYQSPFGLAADLRRCLQAIEGRASPHAFEPGERDHPTRVQLPERLYGRDEDVASLVRAVKRSADGSRELVFVTGYSGIGKTSLVNEVHRPMVESGGAFISGKCDQYLRGTPYAALAAAFGQFCLGVLAGSAEDVERWRGRLRAALGDAGALMADLVPSLALVVGPQPPPPRVPAAEAEMRLHLTFQRFVGALAGPEHPLVLFLDDLQWADLPTIRLLEVLATDHAVTHLMVIGAYRDNEVDATHPLTRTLDSLRARGVPYEALTLTPLRRADVRRFVQDALRSDDDDVEDLAALLYQKTGGNPFFLNQLLASIEASGGLRYDAAAGRWRWSMEALLALELTDNVVDLMTQKIRQLPPATQRVLSVASILGTSFQVDALAEIVGADAGAVARDLRPALAFGLVVEVEGRESQLEFGHDRVQEAAYSLAKAPDRATLHRRIGQLLADQVDDLEADDAVFAVTAHLNAASALLVGDEAIWLARLNLAAGRRARASAAYDAARDHLVAGLGLLGPEPFARDHGLACALTLEAATAAFLVKRFAEADAHVETVLTRSTSVLDRVRALEVRMASLTAQNKLHETIRTGVRALGLLGVELPESPGLDAVQAAMGACGARLAGLDLAALAAGPEVTDEGQREAMRLLMDLAASAYMVTPMLMPLIATNIVDITITSGVGPASAYGFALYGLVLCGVGAIEPGYQLGTYGAGLAARFPEARREGLRARHVWYGFSRHWKEPVHDILGPYAALFQEAADVGDFEYAGFTAMLYSMYAVHSGRPLDVILPEIARYTDAMHLFRQQMTLALHSIFHQMALNLAGDSEDPLVLTGRVYDEPSMLAMFTEIGDPTSLFVLHLCKTILAFTLGDYERAWTAAQSALEFETAGGTATLHLPVFRTMHALMALWRSEAGAPTLDAATESRAKVDAWAAANPANLAQKAALMAAEWARAAGDDAAAAAHYEAAIAAAQANAWTHDEGLANELAARFYQARGRTTIARAFLLEARFAYQRWGARAKEAQLAAAYPALFVGGVAPGARAGTITATTTVTGDLDVETVVRASQAISQEIVLSSLVRTLMTLALEASGARRGVLLILQDEALSVAAVGQSEPEVTVDVAGLSGPQALAEVVPHSVVQYVQRTGHEVLLADAAGEGLFVGDPYIRDGQVRSVLALPVSHQGALRAVMYLENDRTVGVFSEARLPLARVLLAQAAISIDNAMLYESLEEKVRTRTRDLETARDDAQRAHRRSDAILFNVLPPAVAEELKQRGTAKPVHVASASVLFTDFVGFTAVAESLTPDELVDDLERYFSAFDEIMDRHGLEKLKTIGDAYMAAGGVPQPSATHLIDVLRAALDIIDYTRWRRSLARGAGFEVRVGVHTGPLVAGVIGRRRFAYDVWGDTVNTASRLESSGAPGRINVSADVAEAVSHLFTCEPRGPIVVKGKGAIDMHFIDGLRPALSVDGDGRTPNQAFWALVTGG